MSIIEDLPAVAATDREIARVRQGEADWRRRRIQASDRYEAAARKAKADRDAALLAGQELPPMPDDADFRVDGDPEVFRRAIADLLEQRRDAIRAHAPTILARVERADTETRLRLRPHLEALRALTDAANELRRLADEVERTRNPAHVNRPNLSVEEVCTVAETGTSLVDSFPRDPEDGSFNAQLTKSGAGRGI